MAIKKEGKGAHGERMGFGKCSFQFGQLRLLCVVEVSSKYEVSSSYDTLVEYEHKQRLPTVGLPLHPSRIREHGRRSATGGPRQVTCRAKASPLSVRDGRDGRDDRYCAQNPFCFVLHLGVFASFSCRSLSRRANFPWTLGVKRGTTPWKSEKQGRPLVVSARGR